MPNPIAIRLFLLATVIAFTVVSTGCEQQALQTGEADPDSAVTSMSLFPITQGGLWGYIDSTGTPVIQPRFNRAFHFYDGMALVETDSGFGYINQEGEFAVEPRFEDGWHFAGDVAPVQANGKWGFIDRSGDMVVDPQFDLRPETYVEADYQPRQHHLMLSEGRYGYRSNAGDTVIEPRFDQAWYFSDGLARVKVDGQWGFIDPEGDLVIEPQYDLAWDFADGLALVMVDEKYGYINRTGKYVWNPSE